MTKSQLATKIDKNIKIALVEYCADTGFKINKFLEEAILDKLEELIDSAEVPFLRKQTTVNFTDVVKQLKKSGKL